MGYMIAEPYSPTPAELRARFKAYQGYLQTAAARKRLPPRAFEFAMAPWHYDHTDHRCPHDSWLNSFELLEPASGDRSEKRRLEIRIDLLAPYHDGRIRITYLGVREYSLFQPLEHGSYDPPQRGHGDWLIDEISPSAKANSDFPLAVHEIVFSNEGTWTIVAEEILYQWIPDASQ